MPTPTQPTTEADTAAHDEQHTPAGHLPYGCRCGARWGGTKTAHCPADCHLTFSTPANFDRHRRGGVCNVPGDVGLVPLRRAGYLVFGQPDTDPRTARTTEGETR